MFMVEAFAEGPAPPHARRDSSRDAADAARVCAVLSGARWFAAIDEYARYIGRAVLHTSLK